MTSCRPVDVASKRSTTVRAQICIRRRNTFSDKEVSLLLHVHFTNTLISVYEVNVYIFSHRDVTETLEQKVTLQHYNGANPVVVNPHL